MSVDLFAGVPVSDYPRAVAWYQRLLGAEPAFVPNEREAVWELADHRYLYVELLPDRAGRAMSTLFVDDLDGWVDGIRSRGIVPTSEEAYANGVRKVLYRDPDGNEVGLGGFATAPVGN